AVGELSDLYQDHQRAAEDDGPSRRILAAIQPAMGGSRGAEFYRRFLPVSIPRRRFSASGGYLYELPVGDELLFCPPDVQYRREISFYCYRAVRRVFEVRRQQ